jgi:hypothetical protein
LQSGNADAPAIAGLAANSGLALAIATSAANADFIVVFSFFIAAWRAALYRRDRQRIYRKEPRRPCSLSKLRAAVGLRIRIRTGSRSLSACLVFWLNRRSAGTQVSFEP